MTKRCFRCGLEKSRSSFYPDRSKGVNGVSSACRECSKKAWSAKLTPDQKREKMRQYRAKNRQRMDGNDRKNRQAVKQFCNGVKRQGCIYCGYSEYPEAIDFHHLGGKDKEVSKCKSIGNARMEIAKCVTLCAICHRLVHSGRLILEHTVVEVHESKATPPLLRLMREDRKASNE